MNKKDTPVIGYDERELDELIKQHPGAEGPIRKIVKDKSEYYSKNPFYQKEKTIYIEQIKKFFTFRNLSFKEEKESKEKAEKKIEKKEDKLKIIYDKDLSSLEIKPIDWIIEELIPKNSICVIGGKRGTYKSATSVVLSYSIAQGLPFLNKFSTKKTKVLYIDAENDVSLIKDRVDKIKKGLNLNTDSDVAFLPYARFRFDDPSEVEKLKRTLEDFKPEVIVIDSFRRFIGFDENDAGFISNLFTNHLKPITEKYGVTWILLHHLRKGMAGKNPIDDMDELRVSSDLANCADIILILQRNRGSENSFILKQAKCRYKQEMDPKRVNFEWTEDSLRMECAGDAEDALCADEECAKRIIKFMAEHQKTTLYTSEAIEAMKSYKYSKATVERGLKMNLDNNILIKPRRGYYELNPEKNKPSEPQKPLDAFESKDSNKPSETSDYKIERVVMDGTEFVKVE